MTNELDLHAVIKKVYEPKIQTLIERLVQGHHILDSEKTYLQGQIRGRREALEELINFTREIINATD